MKYTTRQYAAALMGALGGKKKSQQKEAIRRFLGLLARNGAGPRLGLILAEVEKNQLREQGLKKMEIESASPLTPAVRKVLGSVFGGTTHHEEKINPELLAGIKLLIDGETLIDATGVAQLKKLFSKF